MKERPILFSGEMVRAILDGRKTQTRRFVKGDLREIFSGLRKSPYGPVGDHLWVRETWRTVKSLDRFKPVDLPSAHSMIEGQTLCPPVEYLATPHNVYEGKVRASIHMPRWASRINLETTAKRFERLQDISVAEIKAEGITIELFKSLLRPIAEKLKVEEPHWICHHEMDECGTFCFKCGEKRRKQLLKTATEEQKHNLGFLDGGWTTEFDSPPRCETCEMPLHYNPTDYCFEEEMSHFIENGCYPNPLDAYEMLALIDTTNFHNDKNTQDFLKIAWRFLWNSINGKPLKDGTNISWDANPMILVINFSGGKLI